MSVSILVSSAAADGFSSLEQVAQQHRQREWFATRGQMERWLETADVIEGSEVWDFQLLFQRQGEGWTLRLAVQPVAGDGVVARGESVAWGSAGSLRLFQAPAGEEARQHPVASLGAGVAWSTGPGGAEAMLLPALLVGDDNLPPVAAAVAEGAGPCPGAPARSCSSLHLGWADREGQSVLWIEEGSGEVYQVESRQPVDPAAPEGASPFRVVRVRFQPLPTDPTPAILTFQPPAGTAMAEEELTLEGARIAFAAPPPTPADAITDSPGAEEGDAFEGLSEEELWGDGGEIYDGGFVDSVEVRLQTIPVRVVADDGAVLEGLQREDFRVFLGRREVTIQAVDWVTSDQPITAQLEPEVLEASGITVDPPGKLVVLFVQADLHPSRASGHLRLLPKIEELLESFTAEDSVAVVSFDSHLKLQQDFTRDPREILDAVENGIRRREPPRHRPGRYPSLARHFDVAAGKDAATPESALRLTAEAMIPLHGEKVVVYAGWGLGRYHNGGVSMLGEYTDTLRALTEARSSVFVLDITSADFHTLELGLKAVAEATGGQYFSTFHFAGQKVHRLARTLKGHYIVTFEHPPLKGRSSVRVGLQAGRKGTVLAPRRVLTPGS